jgi:glucan phosphoethanolaminetransferase (alkaline phosphatase superfamily)
MFIPLWIIMLLILFYDKDLVSEMFTGAFWIALGILAFLILSKVWNFLDLVINSQIFIYTVDVVGTAFIVIVILAAIFHKQWTKAWKYFEELGNRWGI